MLAPTAVLRRRAALTGRLREFFQTRDFTEVDTFIAIDAPAPEAGITPVRVAPLVGRSGRRHFLQTSPELGMKRLLAGGWERIYQLAPVFRAGDSGPWHRPEFRLLEWYRRGAGWLEAMEDCEALLAHLTEGRQQLTWRGRPFALTRPFPRLPLEALFLEHVGFSILEASTQPALAAALARAGIHHQASDSWQDLFHRAFLARIQPQLEALAQPVFLTHFPAPAAALARLAPEDPRASERFEWMMGGCELANGFGELTCPSTQRERFAHELAAKPGPARPLDEAFLADLAHLPPSAGCAVGWERLLMVLCDVDDLAPLEFVPWAPPAPRGVNARRRPRHRLHTNPLSRHARDSLDLGAWARPARGGRPIALDIGCGTGAFTVALAAARPGWDVIGVELRPHLVDRVNREMAARGLTSGRAVLANAQVHLPELVPPASVAMVAINFPDPWFKKRHHKRRLVSSGWLAQLAHYLAPGAELHVVTDFAPLAEAMASALGGARGFSSLHPTRRFLPDSSTGIRSEREATHMRRGAPIFRLHAVFEGPPPRPREATFLLASHAEAR